MASKTKKPRKTKHGVRIISADEDLAALFDESSETEAIEPSVKNAHRPSRLSPDAPPAADNALTESSPPHSTAPLSPQSNASLKPSPDGDDEEEEEEEEDFEAMLEASLSAVKTKQSHPRPRSPLSAHAKKSFKPSLDDDEEEEDFQAMLEASLSAVKIEAVLKEKQAEIKKQALSIKELRKTRPHPQMQLDLHGCDRKQAERKTASFIYSAVYKKLKTVRIIVGKGVHSPTVAVLPDIIEKKIIALRKERLVLAYFWEKRKKRKSGAMIVYLV